MTIRANSKQYSAILSGLDGFIYRTFTADNQFAGRDCTEWVMSGRLAAGTRKPTITTRGSGFAISYHSAHWINVEAK